jgi:hypothetical protein
MSRKLEAPANAPGSSTTEVAALTVWLRAFRVELTVFAAAFLVLAGFSSQRFWRQSAAPHFVYQAKAWLEGHQDIDAQVLPNIEDWACVRELGGVRQRCAAPLVPSDRWYSSFPWFPSVVMLPFVALNGYQLNDTSFGVLLAAMALALFYGTLRKLSDEEATGRTPVDNAVLALLLGFGTVFFYGAIRGEVWFLAEVLGVGLTALYVRNALGARHPRLAGLFWSMAVLTRTPLLFTGTFFVLEALVPTAGQRAKEWAAFRARPGPKLKLLRDFALGAAPLGLLAAWSNLSRFGSVVEFGHRYFFNNRVNADIDAWGLFSPHYLWRNLEAAFLRLPSVSAQAPQLTYDPWGMSLFITLPLLALAFVPASRPRQAWQAAAAMAITLAASALWPALPPTPGEPPVGFRPLGLWVVLAVTLGLLARFAWTWAQEQDAPRLLVPVLVTLVACMAPGLVYQNTGYAQFGFRFSLDYTPYVLLLLALGRWDFRKGLPLALAGLSVAVGVWGAAAFRGFTELVRGWR